LIFGGIDCKIVTLQSREALLQLRLDYVIVQ